jgi:hypothetical protein
MSSSQLSRDRLRADTLLNVKIAAAMSVAERAKEHADKPGAYHSALLALHALLLQMRDVKLGFSEHHRAAVRAVEKIVCARKFVACVQKAAQFGRRRRAVVRELVQTELSFTVGLEHLLAASAAPLWEPSLQRRVFQNVELLARFHRDRLLPAIQTADERRSASLLSAAIHLLVDQQALYTTYVNGYDDAAAALHAAVVSTPALAAWLDAQAGNASVGCGLARLSALLVTPVQRIPRYCLLMRDLIAFAAATGDAAEELHKSLAVLQTLAAHINDEKAKHQNGKLVRAICDRSDATLRQLLTLTTKERVAHAFVEKRLGKPTLCRQCAKMMLFGLVAKVRECAACGFVCHSACVAAVPPSCSAEPEELDGDFIDLVRKSGGLLGGGGAADDEPASGVRAALLAAACVYSGAFSKKSIDLAAAIVFDDEIVLAAAAGAAFSCAGVIPLADGIVAQVSAPTRTVTVTLASETHTLQFATAELAKGTAVAINCREQGKKKKKRVRRHKTAPALNEQWSLV